ncbi:MAG: 50S ribosomal protein L9 [Pseudomonas fluorescens]|nr:MAG: 50S ribosomal protein L9 [Pseudomonas fluorescens]
MAHMQVILLEALQGVGKIGDTVRVKAGFARNFLLPRSKALVANKTNVEAFAAQKADLEAKSATAKAAAEKKATELEGIKLELSRYASETGQLYGSVKAKDLVSELSAKGVEVEASQILIATALKEVGEHSIRVALHPEVMLTVPVIISRQSL